MKKKTRRLATRRYVARLTLSVLCILIALFIEGTAANFVLKSIAIQNAENEGETANHTAYGYVTWTDDEVEAYNSAVAAKSELIQNNDTAKFFADMGGSITGRIFRVIVVILVALWIFVSAIFVWGSTSRLCERFAKWRDKKLRGKEAKDEVNGNPVTETA